MASGSPSTRRTISAIASTLSGPSTKPGFDAAARSTNNLTAATLAISSADVATAATASGSTRHTCSPARPSTSRLVVSTVRSGHAASRRSVEPSHGGTKVLAVVEHEQGTAAAQELDQRLLQGEMLALLDVDGGGNRCHRQQRVVDRREVDDVHLATSPVPHVCRHPHREPGLADATRADEGDEAVLAQPSDDAGQVGAAADERRHLDRRDP